MTVSGRSRTQGSWNLEDAYPEEGCPICRIASQNVERYLEATNYDALGDPGIRATLTESTGYCGEHAQQWLSIAFVLGTATLYRDVLRRLTGELRNMRPRRASVGGRVVAALGRQGQDDERSSVDLGVARNPCPACELRRESETSLVRTLVASLDDADARARYEMSDGLCIPHLRRALGQARGHERFACLRDHALARQEVLLGHLDEIVRKHDYRHREEPSGEEKGAATRTVRHVAGIPEPVRNRRS